MRDLLIQEDLIESVTELSLTEPLKILDGGCGLGEMSRWFSQLGHQVVAVDLSSKMIEETKGQNQDSQSITYINDKVQTVLEGSDPFDIIGLFALLEWVEHPIALIEQALDSLKPNGYLSLAFYNRNWAIFNALTRGTFDRVRQGDFSSSRPRSLTPPNTIDPQEVIRCIQQKGYEVVLFRGLRCFYDYFFSVEPPGIAITEGFGLLPAHFPLTDARTSRRDNERRFEEVLEMERSVRCQPPFRDIARYIHIIAQRAIER